MPSPEKGPLRRKLMVIHNPVAGRNNDLLVSTLNHLNKWDIHCDVIPTQRPGHGTFLARRAVSQGGYDGVIAAGGDGTCNEVAHGLLGSTLAMGILPIGTANVLAMETGLKFSSASLARTLAYGPSIPIYLGQIKDNIFLLMAGAGFDGRVVADVSKTMKRNFGKWAYVFMAARHIFFTPPERIEVEVGQQTFDAGWVLVCNAAHYGGSFRVAPEADLRQPGFQVLAFDNRTLWGRLGSLVGLILNRAEKQAGSRVFHCSRICLRGKPGEPLQVDGDSAGTLPVEINVSPSQLNLIFPEINSFNVGHSLGNQFLTTLPTC